ncbi:MAG: exodeoxyribonuclease VII large subunit [Candidatus Jacksonbacteria bacterium RIFCSPLOWO2_02_FULL_43_9]|nr:MAG: Exodeoxyribonuclease 7 large subunit [Parcubacteria group bacterium GW2011_GWA2_43_13]OGY71406.1 MAG: exodeoxyribonuclease VII large subunit [Candidatus Jacksonbacteria bacterium RIFCSPLOWO2_01_FULL_44_13]OGY73151.1 MAG: exodeoxyribonuclease VII large subunit [Candidatus Jacksonbacteria bacterium RIFCSPLOWO2_02_FULL_43_9]HAZ17059.1 exodeoxyribonuclease VII large subunit [Candidatus Jacksonbacteria bacterium]
MRIYSVSECVREISLYLEQLGSVVVKGEVTGFRRARNGQLVYFELKDEGSRLLCFCLGYELPMDLEDGQEIHVVGVPQLFKTTGGFHIRVQEVQLIGEGALQQAYRRLFERLEREGLFAQERKRSLPRFPQRIGLITSEDAAAYSDFMRILNNRWSGVVVRFYPSGVQGPGAIRQIVNAIEYMNTHEQVDVLVLTRGGGSLEDLQVFNSEEVVRAVIASRVPVVVGVGHERDTTLADYVADVRASTPSHAAERVVPDKSVIVQEMSDSIVAMRCAIARQVTFISSRISYQLKVCERWMYSFISAVSQYEYLLIMKMRSFARMALERVGALDRLLGSLSPQSVLERGYSISIVDGKGICDLDASFEGKTMVTRLAKGTLDSVIRHVKF